MELLLGCGNSRIKRVRPGWTPEAWNKLVTFDIDPNCGADILGDFEDGLPFADNTFDEVHAYDVMEHFGTQGDYRAFFRHFGEVYRVLKPYGLFCGITPHWNGPWLWNDPGHRRSISLYTLAFLNQSTYADEVGVTALTDYRWLWKGDMKLVSAHTTTNPDGTDSGNVWILQAHKPGSVPRSAMSETKGA